MRSHKRRCLNTECVMGDVLSVHGKDAFSLRLWMGARCVSTSSITHLISRHLIGKRNPQHGSTLVELIIVMVIVGILVASAGMLFLAPMRGYIDSSRRAMLVDLADTSLLLMQRELRAALPNSVRITGDTLEFVPIAYAGRYRAQPVGDVLDFTQPDSSFNAFAANVPDLSSTRLVVFPADAPSIYGGGSAIMTPSTTTLSHTDGASEDTITLSSPFQFDYSSPEQRFYVVTEPVSYVCDENGGTGTGTITRHSGYGFSVTQSTTPAGTADPLTDYVASCAFTYSPSAGGRSAVVSLALSLRDSSSGEQVKLMEQVQVDNVP